jgi:hypothetical protein
MKIAKYHRSHTGTTFRIKEHMMKEADERRVQRGKQVVRYRDVGLRIAPGMGLVFARWIKNTRR